MITAAGNILHRIGYCRRARSRGKRRSTALKRRNALFKNIRGRVHKSCVYIAALCQPEAPRRLSGILKHIGGGCIYRYRACVCRGIGAFLPYVKLKCFKFIIAHFRFPFRKCVSCL